MEQQRVISLRMERQCLSHKADVSEYISLFRILSLAKTYTGTALGTLPALPFVRILTILPLTGSVKKSGRC